MNRTRFVWRRGVRRRFALAGGRHREDVAPFNWESKGRIRGSSETALIRPGRPAAFASSHEPALWNQQQRPADLFQCGRPPARDWSSRQRLPGLACGDTGPAADAASRIAGILGLASFNLATERSTSCAMD